MCIRDRNLAIAATAAPQILSSNDLAILDQARTIFQTMALVPCTQCSYCMPCPCGLNIPTIYQLYNRSACERDLKKVTEDYFALTTPAAECVQCGICQGLCPQHIAGQEWMPQVEEFFQKTREKLEMCIRDSAIPLLLVVKLALRPSRHRAVAPAAAKILLSYPL